MFNLEDVYFRLLIDNFLSSSILPVHKPWMFEVMEFFGYYDYKTMLIYSMIGSCLGDFLNYFLGFFFGRFEFVYNKYLHLLVGILIIFCNWIPVIGSVLSCSSGVIKMRFYYALTIVAFSNISYFLIFYAAS